MRYLWCDIESTGTDFNKCSICEIGCFITDDDFIVKHPFHEIIRHDAAYWEQGALQMHVNNGLIDDMHSNIARPELEVKESFKNYLEKHRFDDSLYCLAGSSVHFDKNILNAQWGLNTTNYFSHRVADISSIKVLLKSLTGSDDNPSEMRFSNHRAMDDIRYSLNLFKHFVNKGYIGNLVSSIS
jgi:oligoribonuclease (3'-5' exoribonuclease)